jgi:hypothetical protein
MKLYFSDFFGVSRADLRKHGAFNVSLLSDLPLFIDPFLLFNSRKSEYRQLHQTIIDYLIFLRNKSSNVALDIGLIRALYTFREVKQTWLGFSEVGNEGRGLGPKFARALHANLHRIFHDFGKEQISKGTHLEKLCLIEAGVGRDNISDFTTNLIKNYLLEYTEAFTKQCIDKKLRSRFEVEKVHFNYKTETWESRRFVLPKYEDDFVLLTPKNLLTKEDTWINRDDLASDFEAVRDALPNDQLRALVNNYFMKVLPKNPSEAERREARLETIRQFPDLVDQYIRYKEDHGPEAVKASEDKVRFSERVYLDQFGALPEMLNKYSAFYTVPGRTYEEAKQRVGFLKDVIEKKGGHKIFYVKGKPIHRETDVHILYRLTWFATTSDVSREVDDGRGPADFKVSKGAKDKTLVEFKLASNPQLEKNLANQTKVYQQASDAQHAIRVIIYFSKQEYDRVITILKRLNLEKDETIVLVDARSDNKPSGSKAKAA